MENRDKLKLTTQMWSELGRMDTRIKALHDTVYMPMITGRNDGKILTATAELNTFKEVFENLLCETDIKAKSSITAAS